MRQRRAAWRDPCPARGVTRRGVRCTHWFDSLCFFEVVRVYPFRVIGPGGSNPNVKIDHELRQTATIDENYLRVNSLHICQRFGRKRSGCNENSFFARLPCNAPTNFWISGRPTVPSHFLAWR
jgi:hypothetical protein